MHQELIKKVKFFKKKSPHFIAFVGPMLKPIKVEKGQYIYKEGAPIDEIYFLVSGQAGYASIQYHDAVYIIIDKGYYFGEIDFIYTDENGENNGKRNFSAIAIEDCDLLVLSKSDLLLADQAFEDVFKELFKDSTLRLKRTLKIRKEAMKFYRKQEKMLNPGEGFQARISKPPTADNTFVSGFQNKLNNHGGNENVKLNHKGTLIMSTMQQLDDGELDNQLDDSSSEEYDDELADPYDENNSPKSKGNSIGKISRSESYISRTEKIQNEQLRKSLNVVQKKVEMGSKQTKEHSKSLVENAFILSGALNQEILEIDREVSEDISKEEISNSILKKKASITKESAHQVNQQRTQRSRKSRILEEDFKSSPGGLKIKK